MKRTWFSDKISKIIPIVISSYQNGQTIRNIAKKVKINIKTVRKILLQNEIEIRHARKNLLGQVFGMLKVVQLANDDISNRKTMWKCVCECGKTHFARSNDLKMGKIVSCGCFRNSLATGRLSKYMRELKKNGKRPTNWKGCGEIGQTYITTIKSSALKRGREFNITNEFLWNLYIQQKRKCALSGLDINFSCYSEKQTASLDRIDSSKGYLADNVQWVHRDANYMK